MEDGFCSIKNRIKINMKHVKKFESFTDIFLGSRKNEREINFTHKRNPRLQIRITVSGGRISNIENDSSIRFPFVVGQGLNRNIEVWACNNNFLMDGKDTCPEKKIFGVRAKDVPQGHEWRHIFPNKFK